MELQGRVGQLRRDGLGLAAISYDSRDTLAAFGAKRGLTFPLLSDPGSETIKRYGLLNTTVQPGTPQYGIPFPGTFVLNERGRVTARFFEERYQERNTVSSILVRLNRAGGGTGTKIATDHFTLVTSASDEVVAPGTRFSLILDFTPRRGIHVYAPNQPNYQPLALTIDAQPAVRPHPIAYPPSEEYHFAPLDERVQVYQKPFRLAQDVTIDASRESQARLKDQATLTITGRVDYQACDDKICFNPASVPVSWTLRLKPLDRPQ